MPAKAVSTGRSWRKAAMSGFLILALSVTWAGTAWASMYLDPIRINMGNRDRTASVTVVNQNTRETVFRIYWQDYIMKRDGTYDVLPADETTQWSLRSFVRYSPRQVVLRPGESQAIRFAVRKPRDLPEGEYRSHLVVAEQPQGQPPGPPPAGGGIQLNISFAMAMSVPVVVRHGTNLSATVTMPQLSWRRADNGKWEISAQFISAGNRSPDGAIRLFWQDPDGTETLIGVRNGVAIWFPTRELDFTIEVERPTRGGRLRFEYREAKPLSRGTRRDSDFGALYAEGFLN